MSTSKVQRQEITDAVMALSRVSTAIGHLIGAVDGLEMRLKHAENDRDSFKERYIEAKELLADIVATDALNNAVDERLHRYAEKFIGIYHDDIDDVYFEEEKSEESEEEEQFDVDG